ncbi:hypothetical protein DFH08DRAFT_894065 [Mycena albidolilacea]|uniref:Protein kinase domain-containing protein n=1 Tax=Mycena albidolilacea TaxID=1033008 RepID=A0AAD6ZCK9_9AGAR|nr:hypothetical protein DFH08DRAFT_894065 [Mycena albidolilacea]
MHPSGSSTLLAAQDAAPWLGALFPTLRDLAFPDIPFPNPNHAAYTPTGRDHERVPGDTGSGSSNGDDDSSYLQGSSDEYGSSDEHSQRAMSTTIVSGSLRLGGHWEGQVAKPSGYSVHITGPLSGGANGFVYAGVLVKKGIRVSEIAIKVSDHQQTLLDEFSRYRQLEKVMGPYIPQCFVVCVAAGTAFLVTALLQDRGSGQSLTKAERGAIYQALRTMHEAGWSHSDIVDPTSTAIHNVLWTDTGRPVLIDFVTATPHICKNSDCPELRAARRVLGLGKYMIQIWARPPMAQHAPRV